MSFDKYRFFQVVMLIVATMLTTTAVALAAYKVAPVTNLHLVNGSASVVKITWNAPEHASTSSATIDQYIIKRDGHHLLPLQGFNGMVDTSYVDENPSQRKAKYTVIAVDSDGKRSPPTTLKVPAPEVASADPQPSEEDDNTSGDIQGSSMCDTVIPANIRGLNSPTALEKYGCGAGMSWVNDDSKPKAGVLHPEGAVTGPIHWVFQTLFIQIWVSIGHACWLLVSALYIWVMSASTYLGIANLFGGQLQTFHGNPNFSDLLLVALAFGLFNMARHIFKNDTRSGRVSIIRTMLALTLVTVFLGGAQIWMRSAVEKPLAVYSAVTSQLTSASAGTDVSRDFNLTVHPTYGGDKTKNAIREAENADWLMWQYLPQCAINFGDFQWVTNHYYPDTHTTWCEKFVQIWGSGSDDDKDKFKNELKDANEEVYTYFKGENQMGRVLDTDISKFVLAWHNVMKGIMKLSVFVGIFLLLAELLLLIVVLISNITGSDEARYAAERRIRSGAHWLKIAFVMTVFALGYLMVEAYIISGSTDSGFLWVNGKAFLLECVVAYGTWRYFKKAQREHHEAMERAGAYRESSGWLRQAAGRAIGYAAAGMTAGMSSEYMRERAEKKRGESASSTDNAHSHSEPEQPPHQLLEEHASSDAQSWDTTADAAEEPIPLLEMRTGSDSNGYDSRSNGSGPRRPGGSSGSGGSAASMDGNDYDAPIFDADVVEDDADVMDHDSRDERERRRDYDLRDER
jgi:uncharacterized membrane protein YgcG